MRSCSAAPSPASVFPSSIPVEALDPDRSTSDGRRVLAVEKVNILSASATISGDRVVISRFTFEVGDPKHLGYVVNVVRNARASTTSTG
jgi:GTP diphosphokinase / guanosine-3',5'-bis(diphosphate) 3'-diphosphatase